ncbi:hypothetical protein IAT40_002802 [Kwoniella sp. CBS 6097]
MDDSERNSDCGRNHWDSTSNQILGSEVGADWSVGLISNNLETGIRTCSSTGWQQPLFEGKTMPSARAFHQAEDGDTMNLSSTPAALSANGIATSLNGGPSYRMVTSERPLHALPLSTERSTVQQHAKSRGRPRRRCSTIGSPQTSGTANKADDESLRKKRERNTESAAKCRKNKRERELHIEASYGTLERTIEQQNATISYLQATVFALRNENLNLKLQNALPSFNLAAAGMPSFQPGPLSAGPTRSASALDEGKYHRSLTQAYKSHLETPEREQKETEEGIAQFGEGLRFRQHEADLQPASNTDFSQVDHGDWLVQDDSVPDSS